MNKEEITNTTYQNAFGPIRFNMTNDYMFRAVNQKNPLVTKGIICSVLHLNPETIKSVEITNPIELGEYYSSAKPAIHVGFLNFQPFPDYPEFHASYKLKNEKNNMVYSDKFHLNVIDLTHIELSTDADKDSQLDTWAKFFTAKTWEEVIMIAENNPYIAEAAQTLYEAHADEVTEMKCRARRDYYKQKNTTEKIMRELTEKREQLLSENHMLTMENEKLSDENEKLSDENEKLSDENEKLSDENEKLLARIKELEAQVTD